MACKLTLYVVAAFIIGQFSTPGQSLATTPATDSSISAEAHQKYDAGDLDGAEILFKKIIQDSPSSSFAPDAQYHLGWIAYKKKTGEAEARWKAVVDNYPNSAEAPKALIGIAAVHYKAKASKETRIADFEKVLALYPQSSEAQEARLRIGIIHRHRPPDFGKALTILDDLIANSPDQKWRAEAYVEKGLTLQQRYWNEGRKNPGDRAEAVSIFSSVRERFPDQAEAVARGELHLAKHYLYAENNTAKARTALQEILKAYPETSSTTEIPHKIAYCSYAEKDYDKCIQLCESILKQRPGDDWHPYVQYFIADCHLRAGRKAEAKAALEKTAALYPDHEWGKLALGTLRTLDFD